MDYEFWFWMLIAFYAGRTSRMLFYYGRDEKKYKDAFIGIMPK